MPFMPRALLEDIALPAHGGLDFAELEAAGIGIEDVVDFSANLNPWGAPPSVAEAIAKVPISRYPDAESIALRRALARHLAVAVDNIILGNGSSELMWLIGLSYLDPGDRVLIVGPTFGEYQRVAQLMGAEVGLYHARAAVDFRPDLAGLLDLIGGWRPRLVFLCNPNNPTGQYLDRPSIDRLIEHAPDTLLVLDEAYFGFVAQPWPSIDLVSRGVLLLRSMTKDYGLAGLRLGYAVADASTVEALRKVRPPWNVNGMAQAAGLACLEDDLFVRRSRALLADSKEYLAGSLSGLGLRVVPSATSFFLVEVGDAARCRTQLLRQGLLVRDCASFGLPRFVRIAARTLPECQRLVAAVSDLLRGGVIQP